MAKNQTETPRIPKKMNAVRLHSATGPSGLVYEQVEAPEPKDGEVLVRVHAAAITRDELDWPINRFPRIPSFAFSSVVAATGRDVDNVNVGEEVYALSAFERDGAAADYIVVSKEFLAPKPKILDHIESASIPLAALSAWQGLFEHGQLIEGQKVLIHGAAGGVGSFAVQLAHHGAYVIRTVSKRNTLATARRLGADEAIDHTTTRFEDIVHQVDLVFDTAGGDRLARSPAVVRPGGRLVSVASEPSQEQANARGITAIYLIVSPNSRELLEHAKLADSGHLKPVIDEVFPLANTCEAFERSLSPHAAGKIILRIADE